MRFLTFQSVRRPWLLLAVTSVLGFGLAGWLGWRQFGNRARALETPARSDLSDRDTDPEYHPDTVPSFKEALGYINLCRKRKLTEAEVDRVLELARDKNYALTAIYSIGVLQSINELARRDDILAVLVENLKHPNSKVRRSAIGALGNMGAKDKAPLLVPFLQSAQSDERDSARMALTKLGYKLPKKADGGLQD